MMPECLHNKYKIIHAEIAYVKLRQFVARFYLCLNEQPRFTKMVAKRKRLMINQEQIAEVTRRIVENYKPEKIILFGSYAYGTPTEESDLDLLIIKESNIQRHKRGREVRKYLRGLKISVDLIVYTNEEIQKWSNFKPAFITTIIEKGKVLYGQEV
jgi:uncharacterized protein